MKATSNVSKLSFAEINQNKSLKSLPGEVWKDIKGYEGFYAVSNLGRVKSLFRTLVRSNGIKSKVSEKILKGWDAGEGYLCVDLKSNDGRKKSKIHKLVSDAFLPKVTGKMLINHKNLIRSDNRIDNLERVTSRENNCHRVKGKKKYSNLTGVSKASGVRNKKWIARITVNGKPIDLGYFYTEKEAYEARVIYEHENNIQNKYL